MPADRFLLAIIHFDLLHIYKEVNEERRHRRRHAYDKIN